MGVLPPDFHLDNSNGGRWFDRLVNLFIINMKLPKHLKILHFYVLISLLLFLGVQILKEFKVNSPEWVFSYVNDFLVIPIIGLVCLHVVWFIKRDFSLRLNIFSIFSLVFFYSIYFEYYLPMTSSAYIGDLGDVVCYFMGGIVFYLLQKREMVVVHFKRKSISKW